jgi:hypothetical protein
LRVGAHPRERVHATLGLGDVASRGDQRRVISVVQRGGDEGCVSPVGDRERAHADAGLFENHHGSLAQSVLDAGQVIEQKGCLVARSSLSGSAEQDNRRLAIPAQREQRTEVGVCGHDHTILAGGVLEYVKVRRAGEAQGSDVNGVVTGEREEVGE